MVGFAGILKLEDTGVNPETGVQQFDTIDPLTFVYHDIRLTIPAGTTVNFADIPRVLTWLLTKTGKHTRSTVLHDWLCKTKQYSRFFGDVLFYVAMGADDVIGWRRVAMYYGVRIYAVLMRIK